MKYNIDHIEEAVSKKYKKQDKRKPKMKVSGKSVIALKRIIVKKSDKNYRNTH